MEDFRRFRGTDSYLTNEALESAVPVWVRRPSDAELGQMTPDERELCASFDGQRDLGSILAAGRGEDRARRMDVLVLQLRKGAIALLPMSLERLEAEVPAGESDRWWRKLLPQRA